MSGRPSLSMSRKVDAKCRRAARRQNGAFILLARPSATWITTAAPNRLRRPRQPTFPLLRNTAGPSRTSRTQAGSPPLPTMAGNTVRILRLRHDWWKDSSSRAANVRRLNLTGRLVIEQPNSVFRNLRNGKFADVADAGFGQEALRDATADPPGATSIMTVASMSWSPRSVQGPRLWLNDSPESGHWLEVKTAGHAQQSRRHRRSHQNFPLKAVAVQPRIALSATPPPAPDPSISASVRTPLATRNPLARRRRAAPLRRRGRPRPHGEGPDPLRCGCGWRWPLNPIPPRRGSQAGTSPGSSPPRSKRYAPCSRPRRTRLKPALISASPSPLWGVMTRHHRISPGLRVAPGHRALRLNLGLAYFKAERRTGGHLPSSRHCTGKSA